MSAGRRVWSGSPVRALNEADRVKCVAARALTVTAALLPVMLPVALSVAEMV